VSRIHAQIYLATVRFRLHLMESTTVIVKSLSKYILTRFILLL